MSILTPITRIALAGGAATLLYTSFGSHLLINREQPAIEQGYANPEHIRLYSPVNEKGNREFFLKYDNGTETLALPILIGPEGPLVGDAGYYWKSFGNDVKSRLVEESWNELDSDVRKSILKNELEQIVENYGE